MARDKSYAMQTAEKGAFLSLWGENWGLSVYPAFDIDKLKFSFIDVGNNGKGKSFDIYMDTIKDGAVCFDNWAYDIQKGILLKQLAAEKAANQQYPKAYLYSTGNNGEKTIGIANSRVEGKYIINASILVDGKKVFANVQLTFHDLRHLAENFQMAYEARRKELVNIALEKSSGYHKDNAGTRQQATGQQTQQKEAAPAAAAQAHEVKKTEAEPAKTTAATKSLRVKTCTPMTLMKNEKDLAIQVITTEGETKNCMFLQNKIGKVEPKIWSQFLEKTKVEGFVFTAKFSETPKGSLIFEMFAA